MKMNVRGCLRIVNRFLPNKENSFNNHAMKTRLVVLTVLFFSFIGAVNAQFGIRAGVNMANEITSFHEESLSNSFRT